MGLVGDFNVASIFIQNYSEDVNVQANMGETKIYVTTGDSDYDDVNDLVDFNWMSWGWTSNFANDSGFFMPMTGERQYTFKTGDTIVLARSNAPATVASSYSISEIRWYEFPNIVQMKYEQTENGND